MAVNFPRWVEQEEFCSFCKKLMENHKIWVEGDDVHVRYKCNNKKCRYLKLGFGPHYFGGEYYGRKDLFEKFVGNGHKDIEPTPAEPRNFPTTEP